MKRVILKVVLSTLTLLFASGYTLLAQAHCLDNVANGTRISAVSTSPFQFDTYILNCNAPGSTAATGVSGQIGLQTGTSVTMEIANPNTGGAHTFGTDNAITASTCNAAGNISAGSVAVGNLVGGNLHPYVITVSKDTTTVSQYDMAFHCTGPGGDVPSELSAVADALDPAAVGGPNGDLNLMQNH
ncbi:MAG: hypothetical protein HOO93_01490 [Methyloglobulus sp.]|nr:hypothetical protein [Methyloglobulus sp.]